MHNNVIKYLNPSDRDHAASSHVLPEDAPSFYHTDNILPHTQTFTISIGENPLLHSAAPLFSLVSRLPQIHYPEKIQALHQSLTHEISAFERKAQTLNCQTETILVARYVLCALIDERLVLHTQGSDKPWGQHQLLSTFQNDQAVEKRFFVIIERLQTMPERYINLLELIFFCLKLGFKGQFLQQDTHSKLHNIIEHLYATIRLERGEIEKSLSSLPPLKITPTILPKPRRFFSTGLIWAAMLTACIGLSAPLITRHIAFYHLQHDIKHILAQTNDRYDNKTAF